MWSRRGALNTAALCSLLLILAPTLIAQESAAPSGAAPVPASRQAQHVVAITIEGPIDKWMSYSVQRRLERAQALGADGVVFVADSQPTRQEENVESFRNLQENLLRQGVDPRAVPVCIQYNKRDLPEAVPVGEMERVVNYRGVPALEASANSGTGVVETLRQVSEMVLSGLAARIRDPESVAR